jgi:uncharacterized repeat protein (TIGR01451 family)
MSRGETGGAVSTVTKRTLALGLAAVGLAAASAGLATGALTQAPGIPVVREGTPVTICHATASATNPYVQESPDADSIVKDNGHDSHPDDIIPPFSYGENGDQHYAGKNWDARGQAIWGNGCEVPKPPEPTPAPIQVFGSCIDNNGTTFRAVFGYTNPNQQELTIAVGSGNSFSPDPADRGQPSTFTPGTVATAVTVTGNSGTSVTWSVTTAGGTASATVDASSAPCKTDPPPPEKPAIAIGVSCVDNAAGTFSARFSYSAAAAATIPAGTSANTLSPAQAGQSPPSSFDAGTHEFTISGIPDGTTLVWTLTSASTETASATSDFAEKCNPPPQPPPEPISISVTCIQDRGSTFDATFGYVNPNGTPVEIPAGGANSVTFRGSTGPAGQPETFAVGPHANAFTVSNVPTLSDVQWKVTYAGQASVATANEAFPTHCSESPPDPPGAYRIGVFVSCVSNQGSTYSATFGYSNDDTQTTSVPVGDANRFFPAPENRGQPTTFAPGNVERAFTVTGIPTGTRLVWTVTSDEARSADASASFETKCNPGSEPPPAEKPPPAEEVPIGVFVTCVTNHADTYDAVFGYENDNRATQIIPLGPANTFLPAPGNRGQPTTFEPGTVRNAVTVTGIPSGSVLAWTVEFASPRSAVASQYLPTKCSGPPDPPPPPPRPPESGVFATCVLHLGNVRTYDAMFGYVNASEQTVTIPVGRQNLVAPAPVDRGQPSVFRPGIVRHAFTVRNVPRGRDLTWAVRLPNGEIRTTTATARFPRNCITAPAAPVADLILQKTVPGGKVFAGRRVTYTIRVLNRGPNIALRVRIVDAVDQRLELLSASTNRGSCTTSGQRVRCSIAALPPGAVVRFAVAVRPRVGGTIGNVAAVTHSRRDPTPRNNVDRAYVHVIGRAGGVLPAFTG